MLSLFDVPSVDETQPITDSAGDTLTFEVKGDYLLIRKINLSDDEYLKGVSDSLNEWSSPEDEEAWNAYQQIGMPLIMP
ncbi:MAG: hypothetical protein ACOYOE_09325 [Chlorobium sp.]